MADTAPQMGVAPGAANCVMTWFNAAAQRAEVLLNAEEEMRTPSAIAYYEDGEACAGSPAVALLEASESAERVVRNPWCNLTTPGRYPLPGAPKHLDVVAVLLRKLRCDAEACHFGRTVYRTVFACPATFGMLEQEALKAAASAAGFGPVALLPAPIAAARACCHAGIELGDTLLVYDLGAATLDLTLLQRRKKPQDFHIVMPPQQVMIGGNDFDLALYDHCERLALHRFGCRLSHDGLLSFAALAECRRGKESLTSASTARLRFCATSSPNNNPIPFAFDVSSVNVSSVNVSSVNVSSDNGAHSQPFDLSPSLQTSLHRDLQAPADFELEVTHELLATLAEDQVGRATRVVQTMLQQASVEGHRVETLLLIGGGVQMPLLQEALRLVIPETVRLLVGPDLAAAHGAALPFGTMSRRKHGRRAAEPQIPQQEPTAPSPFVASKCNSEPTVPQRNASHRAPDALHAAVEIQRFTGHTERIHVVAYSHDGRWALSGAANTTLTRSPEPGWVTEPLYPLPARANNLLVLRELATGRKVGEFTGLQRAVCQAIFSADGRELIALDQQDQLKIWTATAGGGHGSWSRTRWLPTRFIRWRTLWNPPAGNHSNQSACFAGNRYALSPDGAMLLVGPAQASLSPGGEAQDLALTTQYDSKQSERLVELWDVKAGERLRCLTLASSIACIDSMAVSPDGVFAAVAYRATSKGALRLALCQLADGALLQSTILEAPEALETRKLKLKSLPGNRLQQVESIQFAPSGRELLLRGQGEALLWDLFYWQPMQLFHPPHTGLLTGAAFTPDGQRLLTTATDGALRCWETYSGRQIWLHREADAALSCVAVAPDARTALCGGDDGVVRLIALPETP